MTVLPDEAEALRPGELGREDPARVGIHSEMERL
jgi:hypothetical protein